MTFCRCKALQDVGKASFLAGSSKDFNDQLARKVSTSSRAQSVSQENAFDRRVFTSNPSTGCMKFPLLIFDQNQKLLEKARLQSLSACCCSCLT